MNYFFVITNSKGESRIVPTDDISDIPVQPGDDIVVMDENGNPVDVSLRPDGEDLIVDFKDGTKAVLEGFYKNGEGEEPVTISLNPKLPEADDYEFNSQSGNLPNADKFSLMRYSSTGYINFSQQLDDLDLGSLLSDFRGGVGNGLRTGDSGGGGRSEEGEGFDLPPNLPSNLAPGASPDTASGEVGGPPIIIDLLANDTDPLGRGLEIQAIGGIDVELGSTVTLPSGSVVTVLPDGNVRFEPGEGFDPLGKGETADETFVYSVRDAGGNIATSQVTVTVEGANDPPVANPDETLAAEDTPVSISVLDNDSDPDSNDNLRVTNVSTPSGGTVVINGDNTLTFDPSGDFEYLGIGESEAVTVTYEITDNYGATATSTATFIVFGANDAPEALDDLSATDQNTAIAIDVTLNDSDPDTNDEIVVEGVDQPVRGSVSVDSNNQIVFDPNGEFNYLGDGQTENVTFNYFISDGNGGTDTASVTVVVQGTDDATVINPDSAETDEDTSILIDVLANDSDPDDTLTVASVDDSGLPGDASVTNNGGNVTFVPGTAFNDLAEGETEIVTFTYTTNTGSTETVTVTVTGTNDGPVAVNDTGSVNEGATTTIDLLNNDSDPDTNDTLTVTEINGITAGGTITLPSGALVTVNGDGTVEYDTNGKFDSLDETQTATDTFTYAISDGNGGTDTATATVTINGVDDPTVTVADSATTDEDSSVVIDVLANDSDPDDTLTVASVDDSGLPGDASVTNNGTDVTFVPGTAFNDLAAGETEIVTFTYTTNTGSTETVTVTVTGTNDGPVAVNDTDGVDEDATINVTAANGVIQGPGTDTDADTSDTLTVIAVENSSSIGALVGNPLVGTYGTLILNADGSYSYSADQDAADPLAVGETADDIFTYTISDGNGGTDTATLTITVTGTNDGPIANPPGGTPGTDPGIYDDTDTIAEDDIAPASGNVLANDVDLDSSDVLIVSAVDGLAGNVNNLVAGTYGDITINADGTYDYLLNNGNATVQGLAVGETLVETFTYTADDQNGGTATATLTITITGTNDVPVANPMSGPGVYDDADSITEDAFPNTTDGNVLSNDSDPDGDNLTVAAVNGVTTNVGSQITGTYGAVTINEDGSYDYVLDNSNPTVTALDETQTLTESFTYTADDGNGGTATATLTITINGVDDATVINPDSAETDEDSSVVIDVLANDSDPDDTLTVASVDDSGLPGDASVTNNGTDVTFVPGTAFNDLAAGETEIVTFTYTTNTGSTETVTVTVTGTNDGPVAVNDTDGVDEDATINVTAANGVIQGPGTDTDADASDTLTVIAVENSSSIGGLIGGPLVGTYGTLILNADGSYSYSADQDAADPLAVGETADDIFTYTISDGNGGTDTATLTITVTGTNDGPIANPPGGTPGTDPGIYDDTDTIAEDDIAPASGNVLANDVDLDTSDVLIVSAVDGLAGNVNNLVAGSYGDITINADGTYDYLLNNGNATVQGLAVGETLVETFTYTADDQNGGTATATLTITITGTNDVPVANPMSGPGVYDDADSITEDAFPNTTDGNVLSNDSDPDGDNLTVAAVNGVTTNVGSQITGTYGAVTINEDGSYDYVLDNSNPTVTALDETQTLTESFTYTADDGNGGTATATLTITINGVDDATVINPDSAETDEDTSILIDVLANDSDPDDTLTVASVDDSGLPGDASVTNNGTDVTFVPGTAFNDLAAGETEIVTFTYTTNTGATETVTVTVTGTNDGPVAVNDTDGVDEDATINVTAANGVIQGPGTDTDADGSDVLTVIAVENSSSIGGLIGGPLVGTYGTLILNADGSYSYSADQDAADPLAVGETADDIFTYTISDGNGGTDTAMLTITVTGTNDGPIANPPGGTPGTDPGIYDDTDTIAEDDIAPASGNVLANDVDLDSSDVLIVSAVDGAAGNVNNAVTGSYGDITINADGTYDYLLNNGNATVQGLAVGETLVETFTYTADDQNGGTATATLTITITGTNDVPVANPMSGPGVYDDADSITEDAFPNTTDGNVLSNDSDPDGDSLTVAAVNGVASNVGSQITGTYGAVTINADGSYDYVLDNSNPTVTALDETQTLTESFTYTADDGNGGTATATLTITINGVDDATVINPDSAETDEDSSVVIDVLANDSDPDDTLTVASVDDSGLPGDASVTNNGTDVTFVPGTAFNDLAAGETEIVTFTYTTNTGATETVTVTVTGTNDGPVAVNDTDGVDEDATINITAANGVIQGPGTDTDADASDTLTVIAVENSSSIGGLIGGPLVGTYGTLILNADGSYSYSADQDAADPLAVGETADDIFTYTISDGNGGTDTATLTITVTGTNDGPIANPPGGTPGTDPGIYDDTDTIAEDDIAPASGNVLANDVDLDTSDVLIVSAVDGAAGNVNNLVAGTYGDITINADGTYDYLLNNGNATVQGLAVGETLVETFTYTADDQNGGTATATLTITITGTNDVPVANPMSGPGVYDDADSITEDAFPNTTDGNVLSNDSDPDGDSLTVAAVNGVASNVGSQITGTYGAVTINADGSYDYVLDNSNPTVTALDETQTLTESFTYTADDGNGGTATATLTITINGVDDATVINPDSAETDEDSSVVIDVLANDSDPDDTLTVASVDDSGLPGDASVTNNGTDVTFVPGTAFNDLAAGETEIVTFTYTTNTGATETVTVTVTGTNDGPVAVNDTDGVDEDATINVTAANGVIQGPGTDTDADTSDTLTVIAVENSSSIGGLIGGPLVGTYGTLILNADGSYSYSADQDAADPLAVGETADDIFTYTISDGNGGTDTATLTITVTGTNDGPIANPPGGTPGTDPGIYDDTDTIAEDDIAPASGNVLANDVDLDTSDVLIVSAVDGAAGNVNNLVAGTYGDITINADGTYDYLLNNGNATVQGLAVGETLVETFTYTADDQNGGTATATLTITITGTNDVPVANPMSGPGVYDDADSITEDAFPNTTDGNVLSNDSDPDGDSLTVAAVNGVASNVGSQITGTYGAVTINADGSYDYVLDNSNPTVTALDETQTLTESFTYTADDGNGGTATATLTITINGADDATVINPDSAETDEDSSVVIDVLANDSDPDDTLTVASVDDSGLPGDASVTNNGTDVTFVPGTAFNDLAAGETEIVTFTYTTNTGATETVTVTVTGTNDGPVAVNDTGSVNEGATTTIDLLDNDSDPDSNDTLTVTEINGITAGGTITLPSGALVTVNGDGTVLYDTNGKFDSLDETQTATDTFTYAISDGNGGTDTATATVTINGVDDPTVTVADSATTDEDSSVVIDVLANDSDPDDTLTVASVDDSGLPGDASVTNNGTDVTFVPGTAFNDLAAGETEIVTFTYTTNTGATESVTVTVTGTNDGPVAVNDTDGVDEDATINVTAANGVIQGPGTDTDADTSDTLTVIAVENSSSIGGLIGGPLVGTYGTLILNADGSYSYSADQDAADPLAVGETADDIFTYTISDGNGGTDTATLTITVTGTNDGPIANPPGGTPGTDPGIYDDTDTIAEDDIAPASGNVLANDVDLDTSDVLIVSAVDGLAGNVNNLVAGTYGDITINADGTYDYLLNNGNATVQGLAVGETLVETFTYTADDQNGGTATATLTITITGTNDVPVANPMSGPGVYDDADSITEDAFPNTTDGNVLSNDSDPDGDSLTVAAVNGVASNVGSQITGTYGAVTINADGSYDYVLDNSNPTVTALDETQTLTESFTYTADDGNGGTATATLTITINGADDATVINPDSAETEEDSSVVIDVLANDSDPDDTLTVASVDDSGLPGDASVTNNGTDVTFVPGTAFNDLAAGETEIVTFTYTTNTGSTETVTVTVTGTNDGPVAVNDTGSVNEGATTTLDLLNNDSDPDTNDTLTVTEINGITAGGTITLPSGALVIVNGDGTVEYDTNGKFDSLDETQTATDTFTYAISDGNGGTDTATATVTINGVDDPTVTVADSATTDEDTSILIDVLANDSDPDDTLTVASVDDSGLPGDASVTNNGTDVTFVPGTAFNDLAAGETEIVTFTYTTNTGATETVTVTVTGTNDGPVAVNDTDGVDEDATINVTAANGVIQGPGTDTDADASDTLTVIAVENSSSIGGLIGGPLVGTYGTLILNADGSYSYSADQDAADPLAVGETADDIFTYTISDGNGGTDTATLTITVTGTNDGPIANPPGGTPGTDPGIYDDTDTIAEDDIAPASGNVLANDVDLDSSDVLIVSAVDGAAGNVNNLVAGTYGDITINADGTYDYLLNNGNATVQGLAVGETLVETFTYTADDQNGGTATATLTITITGTNDVPVANPMSGPGVYDDADSITEDAFPNTTDGNVLSNDSDPDGDSLTVAAVNGVASNVGSQITGTYGAVTINADGSYDYVLDNSNPTVTALDETQTLTESFTYTADDGNGGTATATLTITINGADDATVINPDSAETEEDSSVVIDVLANDSDPDDTLTVASVDDSGLPGDASVTNNGTDVTFVPGTAFNDLAAGETEIVTFTYTTNTGATETVTVTVTGTNDGPVAVNDTDGVDEDATINITAANGVIQGPGTDTDADASDTLTVIAVENSSSIGGLIGGPLVGTYGTLILNADGSYSYSADQDAADPLAVGETADDIFTYTISDGNGGTDTATLTITVTGTNDGPIANPPGGTPGTDPGIYDDTDTIAEDDIAPASGNVLANDVDLDSSDVLIVSAVDGLAGNVNNLVAGTYGDITINADGTYDYLLNNGNATVQGLAVGETLVETFTYTADDQNGGTATATLTITITGTNDVPVANPMSGPGVYDDADSITEDAFPNTTDGNVLSNDSDPDGDSLTVAAVNGVASNVGSQITGTYGAVTINADGSYDYVLDNSNPTVTALDETQTLTESFTYTADDGNGGTATATLTITINGADDATVINPDSAETEEDSSVVIDVLANDSDPDDTLTVASVDDSGLPGDASVTNNGTDVTFVPGTAFNDLAAGETEIVTFTYTTNTGATETVTVTVTGTNDGPVAVNDTDGVDEDATINVTAANGVIQGPGTDTDADTSDTLTVIAVENLELYRSTCRQPACRDLWNSDAERRRKLQLQRRPGCGRSTRRR